MDFFNRRSGRTTNIFKKALNSNMDEILILFPTIPMAKYGFKSFIEYYNTTIDATCKYCKQEISLSKCKVDNLRMSVKIGDRIFYFNGEDNIDAVFFKGSPQMDIHRDHTCYENL